jgi:prephenate dehydrogenase
MKILIAGLGLIGGSFAKAFKKHTDHTVLGYDIVPAVTEFALECGAVDRIASPEDFGEADLTLVCLYPKVAVDFILSNFDRFKPGSTVTDACGVKCAVYDGLRDKLGSARFTFIGMHPMAGKEHSGFDYSDADLFVGGGLLLTPDGAPDDRVAALKSTLMQLGFARCNITTPEHHDLMIAYTSQLPHVLACSYIRDPLAKQHTGYSAGSFQDVTRVAYINDVMWSELFLCNRENLSGEIDLLIKHLTEFKDAINGGDRSQLCKMMSASREIKRKV